MNAKVLVSALFACYALLFAGCSKDNENIPGGIEPPKTILDAFNNRYPDAQDTEWTVKNDYYVIEFQNFGQENTAWFNHLGQWAMLKTDLPLNQVPAVITASIQNIDYPGWKIEDADTISRAGMGTVFKVEVEKGAQEADLYYTLYGDLIKAVNAVGNEDAPVIVPEQVITLMEFTYQGCELLDIQTNTSGVQLSLLDGKILKIGELTSTYTWKSTTWKIAPSDVPSAVTNGFNASDFGSDPISSIYILLDANGTFYKFNVSHNGLPATVELDVFGNVVENK